MSILDFTAATPAGELILRDAFSRLSPVLPGFLEQKSYRISLYSTLEYIRPFVPQLHPRASGFIAPTLRHIALGEYMDEALTEDAEIPESLSHEIGHFLDYTIWGHDYEDGAFNRCAEFREAYDRDVDSLRADNFNAIKTAIRNVRSESVDEDDAENVIQTFMESFIENERGPNEVVAETFANMNGFYPYTGTSLVPHFYNCAGLVRIQSLRSGIFPQGNVPPAKNTADFQPDIDITPHLSL